MRRPFCALGFVLAGVLLAAGCAGSPWSAADGSTEPTTTAAPAQPPATPPPNPPVPATAAGGEAKSQAMKAIVADLQQLGELDAAAQERLTADLQRTDPSLWPQVVQQTRALLAYRRQARQAEAKSQPLHGPPVHTVSQQQPLPVESPQAPSRQQHPPGARPVAEIGRLPAANDAALAPSDVPRHDYPSTPSRPAADAPLPAVRDAAGDRQWQAHLVGATRTLEAKIARAPANPDDISQHAQLRMLYLLAGRRDEALQPIHSATPAVQEFWSKELYGLATWLDTRQIPDATRRAAQAKQILDEAVIRLGHSALLTVNNLAFCTKVQSYGCIDPFEKYEFAPEQEVLLYAEIENFSSEPTPKGYHTTLRSSYQIIDANGHRVADNDFTDTEEFCRNLRRDFFIGYHLRLPKRIYPGKYTLQLTVEDLKSHKVGQSSIELTVKDTDQ